MNDLFLIISDVRSCHNVGSLFRTADAAGVSHIFLCGVTPNPIDRFGRADARIAKVSLGAEQAVLWEHCDIHPLLHELKNKGVRIVALEQHGTAVPLMDVPRTYPTALIVGNEVGGITEDVLLKADYVAHIPMRGTKESLNVAVAAGIALFQLAPGQ